MFVQEDVIPPVEPGKKEFLVEINPQHKFSAPSLWPACPRKHGNPQNPFIPDPLLPALTNFGSLGDETDASVFPGNKHGPEYKIVVCPGFKP